MNQASITGDSMKKGRRGRDTVLLRKNYSPDTVFTVERDLRYRKLS